MGQTVTYSTVAHHRYNVLILSVLYLQMAEAFVQEQKAAAPRCKHLKIPANDHNLCDYCRKRRGLQLCDWKHRCEECLNMSDFQFTQYLDNREKNERTKARKGSKAGNISSESVRYQSESGEPQDCQHVHDSDSEGDFEVSQMPKHKPAADKSVLEKLWDDTEQGFKPSTASSPLRSQKRLTPPSSQHMQHTQHSPMEQQLQQSPDTQALQPSQGSQHSKGDFASPRTSAFRATVPAALGAPPPAAPTRATAQTVSTPSRASLLIENMFKNLPDQPSAEDFDLFMLTARSALAAQKVAEPSSSVTVQKQTEMRKQTEMESGRAASDSGFTTGNLETSGREGSVSQGDLSPRRQMKSPVIVIESTAHSATASAAQSGDEGQSSGTEDSSEDSDTSDVPQQETEPSPRRVPHHLYRSVRHTNPERSPRKSIPVRTPPPPRDAYSAERPVIADQPPSRSQSPAASIRSNAGTPVPVTAEELLYRDVMKEIIDLSGAKSGPLPSEKVSTTNVIFKSQGPKPKADPKLAPETAEGITQLITARLLELKEQDKHEAKTLGRVHTSKTLEVRTTPYLSCDAKVPMVALEQPPTSKHAWLPSVKQDSEVPLTEKDLKLLEVLARKMVNILSIQDHTLAAINKNLEGKMHEDPVMDRMFKSLGYATEDLSKLAVNFLLNIVQLRRDVILLHTWDTKLARRLRYSAIEGQSELFPPDETLKVSEENRAYTRDLALVQSTRSGSKPSTSGKPKASKRKADKQPKTPRPKRQKGNGGGSAASTPNRPR